MPEYSKSSAIRTARSVYSQPTGSGTTWTFSGPFHADRPFAGRTQFQDSSYQNARQSRKRVVVETALCLLGVPAQDAAEISFSAVSLQPDYTNKEHLENCLEQWQQIRGGK